MWLSLLGQLVCRECCGYYFALLIHWLSEDVIFPPYYLRLAASCVLGSICPVSFLVCATCNPFLHLPLTAPGADWPKLFCSHLWDESVLWYFLSRLQAHKSSRKRDDFCSPQSQVHQQVGAISALPYGLSSWKQHSSPGSKIT